jgi:hypothetical protein
VALYGARLPALEALIAAAAKKICDVASEQKGEHFH